MADMSFFIGKEIDASASIHEHIGVGQNLLTVSVLTIRSDHDEVRIHFNDAKRLMAFCRKHYIQLKDKRPEPQALAEA